MTFPIPEHETWKKIDSSKLEEFIGCYRKFFYKYLLGWRPAVPQHDLVFGNAWHTGREHQLLFGYDDVQGAYGKFMDEYRETFDESTDQQYAPKNPLGAVTGYLEIAKEYADDLDKYELVEFDGQKATEIAGVVNIGNGRFLNYRMDSIFRRKSDGLIFSMDHKTTKASFIRYGSYADKFYLSQQNGTYTHCLYCLFPMSQVLGLEFCQTGFEYLSRGSKARPAGYYVLFDRVKAYKTPEQMNVWLWNTHDIMDSLDREMDKLSHCKEEDDVMNAFRMSPNNCTAYRGCPYLDFCQSWTNPLRAAAEPPFGFIVEFWDPSAVKSSMRKDLDGPVTL